MISTLIVAGLPGGPSIGNLPFAVALTVLWSVLLIRRSRIAWGILVWLYGLAAIVIVGYSLTVWPVAGLTTAYALIGLLVRPVPPNE